MTTNKPFVTSEELVARGISADAQRKARFAGELPFTVVGADRFAYLESDVSAWLEAARNQQAESRKAIARYAAEKRARQTTTAPAAATADATATWTAAVRAKTAAGIDRASAVRAVDREHPGLREAMISQANQ